MEIENAFEAISELVKSAAVAVDVNIVPVLFGSVNVRSAVGFVTTKVVS